MAATVVDQLYEDYTAILTSLESAGELSLRVTAEDSLRKALLLCAASYFEDSLSGRVMEYVAVASGGSDVISSIVKNKAVSRQYHTWFNWKEGTNANSFFGLFGEGFRDHMKKRVASDGDLNDSIRAFLQLGQARNLLVHEDFGNYTLEKTTKEIYDSYLAGIRFVEEFPQAFVDYTGAQASETAES